MGKAVFSSIASKMLFIPLINRAVNALFSRNVKIGLLVVIIYVISGHLGLMLALQPGYASPLFPAAGIAIAIAFIAGKKMYPWIFLGSFTLNLWVSYSANQSINTLELVTATIIAGASLLQAATGGWVLRKVVGYPCALDHLRDILFVLFLSPFICLIATTVAQGALFYLGVIPIDSLLAHWASWWIGDTLGLMVMLPLTMTFIGSPGALWRSRRITVAIPIVVFLLLFIASFIKVSQWEYSASLSDFRQYSLQTSVQLQSKLHEQESLLEQLAGSFLHDYNDIPSRTEFQRFVKKSLQRYPMLQALSWIPEVSAEQRGAFELAQQQYIANFTINERDENGQLRPATMRDFYYPVTYIEPLQGNDKAIGFDLGSNQHRMDAINNSKQSLNLAISAPITLVQEKHNQKGVLLILAIDHSGAAVVSSILRMSDFMDKLLSELRPLLYTRLIDLGEQTALYDNFKSPSGEVFYTENFTFGARHFRLEMAPTPAYFKAHQSWQSWGVLVISMIGISLLSALLLIGTGNAARIKAQVIERTRELTLSQKKAEKALRDLQYQKFILDQHADVTMTDLQGKITYANNKFCELSGYESHELLGENHRIVNSGVHSKQFFQEIYETIEAGKIWQGEVCNRAKNGHLYWESTTIVPYLDGTGKPLNYIAIRTDITDRVKMEEAVRESECRWKFALEGAGDGVWDWDLRKGTVFFSKRWKEMLGFSDAEIGNNLSEWEARIHGEDKGKTLAALDDYLAGTIPAYVSEHRMKCKDGNWKWILDRGIVVNRDEQQKPIRVIGTHTDITERKLNEQLVQRMAHYDALTNLPNRVLFNDRLKVALAESKRISGHLSVMFIDLDKFKPINDQYGHQVGDLLLQKVAKRIKNCVREADTVGRIGGDEFVVLLAHIKDTEDAVSVAEKIRLVLNSPFELTKRQLSISSSIGIAIYPQHGTDEQQLMKNADIAMYQAKENGRDKTILYTPTV